MATRITETFALWLCLGVGWAWLRPADFTWFLPYIPAGLGIIMLGMGLTLRVADFAAALRDPASVAIGVVAQFALMPALGFGLAQALALPPPLAVGLILVASCPGGTASNVITHLARGNVPLSVLMTACSTLVAVGATPLLTRWLAGAYVPVPAGALLKDMLQLVALPVAAGLLANRLAPRVTGRLAGVAPVASVFFIVLIVGAIVADRKAAIATSGPDLLAAVLLLHAGGFALGRAVAALLGRSPVTGRTIAIEVGMQNSGLGASLARAHFSDPLTAVPAALSALFHSLIGSALAAWWRRQAPAAPPVPPG